MSRETQSGTPEDPSAAAAKLSPVLDPWQSGGDHNEKRTFSTASVNRVGFRCAGHFRYFSNSGGKSDSAALRIGANKDHIARALGSPIRWHNTPSQRAYFIRRWTRNGVATVKRISRLRAAKNGDVPKSPLIKLQPQCRR
jgi:hypothetical protein